MISINTYILYLCPCRPAPPLPPPYSDVGRDPPYAPATAPAVDGKDPAAAPQNSYTHS